MALRPTTKNTSMQRTQQVLTEALAAVQNVGDRPLTKATLHSATPCKPPVTLPALFIWMPFVACSVKSQRRRIKQEQIFCSSHLLTGLLALHLWLPVLLPAPPALLQLLPLPSWKVSHRCQQDPVTSPLQGSSQRHAWPAHRLGTLQTEHAVSGRQRPPHSCPSELQRLCLQTLGPLNAGPAHRTARSDRRFRFVAVAVCAMKNR
jgi:hypothetical protein